MRGEEPNGPDMVGQVGLSASQRSAARPSRAPGSFPPGTGRPGRVPMPSRLLLPPTMPRPAVWYHLPLLPPPGAAAAAAQQQGPATAPRRAGELLPRRRRPMCGASMAAALEAAAVRQQHSTPRTSRQCLMGRATRARPIAALDRGAARVLVHARACMCRRAGLRQAQPTRARGTSPCMGPPVPHGQIPAHRLVSRVTPPSPRL